MSKTILAIDTGTTMGWAISHRNKIKFGEEQFSIKRWGQRFDEFEQWLRAANSEHRLDWVTWEKVARHRGTFAAHVYGGWVAILSAFCEREQISYSGVPVGTIKKHWTGNGTAKKSDMMFEALGRGFKIKTDNEADALALLDYTLKREADK